MPDSRNIGIPSSQSVTPRIQGKNYLFAVGIDTYEHHPPLYNCVRGASGLIDVLTQEYQFNCSADELIFLQNEEATHDKIKDELDNLISKLELGDDLLLYFACHGYYKTSQKSGWGFLVPYDGGTQTKKLISTDFIREYISRCDAHHVFLIVDTCYSGSIFRSGVEISEKDEELYAQKMDLMASRYGLAAGRIELVSDGIAGGHSPFTGKIINFFQKNHIETIAVSSLIYEITKKGYNDKGSQQIPIGGVLDQAGHQGGEFVFRRKVALNRKDRPISTTKIFALHKKINRLRQLEALKSLKNVSKDKVRIAIIKGREEDYPENLIEYFIKESYKSQVHWKINTNHNPPRLNYISITDQVKSYKEACFKMISYWGLQDQQVSSGEELLSKFYDPQKPLILPIKFIQWAPHSVRILEEIMEKFWGLNPTHGKEVYIFITIIYPNEEEVIKKKLWRLTGGTSVDTLPSKKAQKGMNKFLNRLNKNFCDRVCLLPELKRIPIHKVRKFAVDNHDKFPFQKGQEFIAFLDQKKGSNVINLSMLEIEEWIKLNVS